MNEFLQNATWKYEIKSMLVVIVSPLTLNTLAKGPHGLEPCTNEGTLSSRKRQGVGGLKGITKAKC